MKNRVEVVPNERYAKLTVVKEVEKAKTGARRILCKCDCGNLKIADFKNLRKGRIKSCGCLKKGPAKKADTIPRERLYKIRDDIIQRCENPNNDKFHRYGERGIKIYSEWRYSFPAFKEWALNNGYSDNLTIDRIDVNGDYEPTNCRWATSKVQANNKRNNVFITFNGETHTIAEWSDITGIRYGTLERRYKAGRPMEEVFFDGDLRHIRWAAKIKSKQEQFK